MSREIEILSLAQHQVVRVEGGQLGLILRGRRMWRGQHEQVVEATYSRQAADMMVTEWRSRREPSTLRLAGEDGELELDLTKDMAHALAEAAERVMK